MWCEERCTRKKTTSRPDHLWPELWKTTGKNAKLKEKHKWSHEKLHFDNARNCEGSISLSRRTRNLRRPSRMPIWKWKHLGLLLCTTKLWRRLVDHYQIITKTTLQEKETIHYSITIWFANLFLCLKPRRFPQEKLQWIRMEETVKRFRRGTWTKVSRSKRGDRWSKETGRKSTGNLKAKNQKYKGRIVLRGEIVKDDSETFSVFTEQGSSQMTAGKVTDFTSDCLVVQDKQPTQYLLFRK